MAVIESGATADLLTIDATSKAARATQYSSDGLEIGVADGAAANSSTRGFIGAGWNDGNIRHNRSDRLGSQAISTLIPQLYEPFEGATLAVNRWLTTATTMAATQTTIGGMLFNSGNITTINTGYLYTSLKQFSRWMRAPTHFKCRARINHYTNSVVEFGFGAPATFNGATPAGFYWQVTAAGVVQGVMTYNSVDTTTTAITMPGGWNTKYYTWDIIVDDDSARFIVQDTTTGLIIAERVLFLPDTQSRLGSATHFPVYARLYNTGSAPATAPNLIVTDIFVGSLDTLLNKSWGQVMADVGQSSIYQPLTFAQTETNTNSAAPANATLSNTAAGYTTLGGLFSFAAVAGAATDYCLFGFQTPLPYKFVCTGIDIDLYNTVAAVATTPTIFLWSIGINGVTVSCADTGQRRKSIGSQSLLVGAGIGAVATTLSRRFTEAPKVCEAGRFFDVILRMPVGTATATEVFAGQVSVHGFFE